MNVDEKSVPMYNNYAAIGADLRQCFIRGEGIGAVSNIFDDVFKTICERMPDLLIPVINEAFDTNYPPDVRMVRLGNELHIGNKKIAADASFLIEGKRYHVECQSTDDKRMVIRMLEYDLAMALESPQETSEGFDLILPRSCVVYLRGKRPTRGDVKIRVRVEDEMLGEYNMKVLEVQDYSISEIFEKSLIAFVPYFVLRYKSRLDGTGIAKLSAELKELAARLQERYSLNTERLLNLYRLIRDIVEYHFRDDQQAKESAGGFMGGKVLQLESERLREEAQIMTCIKLVDKGKLTEEEAAEFLGISVTEFEKRTKELKALA